MNKQNMWFFIIPIVIISGMFILTLNIGKSTDKGGTKRYKSTESSSYKTLTELADAANKAREGAYLTYTIKSVAMEKEELAVKTKVYQKDNLFRFEESNSKIFFYDTDTKKTLDINGNETEISSASVLATTGIITSSDKFTSSDTKLGKSNEINGYKCTDAAIKTNSFFYSELCISGEYGIPIKNVTKDIKDNIWMTTTVEDISTEPFDESLLTDY